jgi:hypothetical protein
MLYINNSLSTIIIFCLLNTFSVSFSQLNSGLEENKLIKLSRYRLSFGYVNLLSEDDNFIFRHPFFNISFRSSGFDRSSSDIKVKIAFEPGINGLIIAGRDFNNSQSYSLYFVPYLKFGPEIRLYKDLFFAGSVGLAFVSYERNFAPLPFIGFNGFYLYELSNRISVEVESGFHTTMGLPILLYITIGISLI